ncbi:MAG: DUF2442 domain-containing protein [Candidatus Infernicultor aquiphilus]|jgi:hypothetical protein|uniref:DUF2442 domain-containing protein n=1 Tax=Candidatus Infernicultor aquiphilus TaxID=1805029 RepID=A0A1J5GJD2_9BACT|nr:DUF2442 domain-containing protein [bacterium]OIP72905.1 MAG: hypothetical protein AUK42_01625 [Candidatus Atribacteria bacterium CG2_30_33_13]PIY32278.1 MAG: DUF2442 domain-containing protein [Candidatus Atribacteria bacterium CG_4_10_14_3_um_filter_34_13]PJB57119.1 MAG: DUF2442 domain-containing protein [Candidatus Atribacteria bacterium CG_4_9_14_3_um_filter_33_16]
MHFVKKANYVSEYKLLLTFEDGNVRLVDLKPHLEGKIFKPLKDISYFKAVKVNSDLDTIVWKNGADMSPDFLYEIGVSVAKKSA